MYTAYTSLRVRCRSRSLCPSSLT